MDNYDDSWLGWSLCALVKYRRMYLDLGEWGWWLRWKELNKEIPHLLDGGVTAHLAYIYLPLLVNRRSRNPSRRHRESTG